MLGELFVDYAEQNDVYRVNVWEFVMSVIDMGLKDTECHSLYGYEIYDLSSTALSPPAAAWNS